MRNSIQNLESFRKGKLELEANIIKNCLTKVLLPLIVCSGTLIKDYRQF